MERENRREGEGRGGNRKRRGEEGERRGVRGGQRRKREEEGRGGEGKRRGEEGKRKGGKWRGREGQVGEEGETKYQGMDRGKKRQ